MCGIVGVSLDGADLCAASETLEAAVHLQHRGQDACGVITGNTDGTVTSHKGAGLVTAVFNKPHIVDGLQGNFGIGHVRYATNGRSNEMQTQPIIAADCGDVAIVHNGHLENNRQRVIPRATMDFKSKSIGDSEVILATILSRWSSSCPPIQAGQIPSWLLSGISDVYRNCVGSFACILFVPSYGLVAFRDANGIKPIVMAERRTDQGEIDYMFASESTAFRTLGYKFLRDILPGEAIFMPSSCISPTKPRYIARQIVPEISYSPDIFEYVYFARAESVMDGISVYRSRQFMGEALAQTLIKEMAAWGDFSHNEIDCVVPVPETSFTCALGVAKYLKKPLSFGLVRNQFISRTFILPSQKQRENAVKHKLSTVREEFEGKNVLIIDDSIVRGTTATQIVKMAREAGAKKVFFASGCPAIRFKHIYGIELADPTKLIAYGRSMLQIQKTLGCDGVFFLPLEELVKSCILAKCYGGVSYFEVSVFDGSYITKLR